jgi:cystathionine beta-lyase
MRYEFDKLIDRHNSDSTKWRRYDADVLPLWTADMDFASPAPVIEALHRRVDHGVFGYCVDSAELRETVAERLAALHDWQVQPSEILLQSGVIGGFQRVCAVAATQQEGVLVQPPVYPPILEAPRHNGSVHQEAQLARLPDGRYEIDFDALEATIDQRTRVLILCNPHNPVGRVFTRHELERVAEICLRRGLLVCSDEIHCDLLYPGMAHTPVASLDAEIAARSVTLMAPSKTFNVAGLRCSLAVIPDEKLRRRIQAEKTRHFAEVNTLGIVAALAAYRDGQEWLNQVLDYLLKNRDLVVRFVQHELPGMQVLAPEATYLAWIDCRKSGIPGSAYQFFLHHARVALQDGADFGPGGEGFVRLNFGCPRSTLLQALERMKAALET